MKTLNKIGIILGGTLLIFFSSCKETISVDEHLTEIESIKLQGDANRDSLEKAYITLLDEIDNNLDIIRDKEGTIIHGPKEVEKKTSKRDHILNNISIINTLLEENKKKMEKMESSLASYKKGKQELVKSIAQAKDRILLQEQQIDELKKVLEEYDYKVVELNKKLDEQTLISKSLAEKNSTLDKDINRAYFISGTHKELKNKKIIVDEGGMLGIGKTKTLNTEVDKSEFYEVNQRENTTVMLNGKKPKLITKHPINSYTLNFESDNIAQLTIKDPEKFWSTSKYLVIEVQ